jgi:short-subunit dehydrogenase
MKNILITGASSGIGFGLVNKFLENDYRVYTVSRRTESLLELKISKDRLTIIKADVTNSSDQAKIINELSGINNLEIINNAAILIPKPFFY